MWHDMNTSQQKILGLAGILVFLWLIFSLVVSSGAFKDSRSDIPAVAGILFLAIIGIGILSYGARMLSLVQGSNKQADRQDEHRKSHNNLK